MSWEFEDMHDGAYDPKREDRPPLPPRTIKAIAVAVMVELIAIVGSVGVWAALQ